MESTPNPSPSLYGRSLRWCFLSGLSGRISGLCLLGVLWLAGMPFVLAEEAAFDQANQWFEKGEYTQAIEGYETLLQSGRQTPAVHFNLGNAWFRQGSTGKAIYHYLMAQTLDPLDPDIQANLKFARDSAGLPANGVVPAWKRWIKKIPLNAWATITLLPLWGYCLLKAWCFFQSGKPGMAQGIRSLLGWTIAPGLLLFAFIAWSISSQQTGVIIQDKAELHASPFEDSKVMGTLKAGEEILLMAKKNQWQQIKNTAGELGWLESKQILPIPVH